MRERDKDIDDKLLGITNEDDGVKYDDDNEDDDKKGDKDDNKDKDKGKD